MYDISSSQFILVLIFIGLLLLFCPCNVSGFKSGGHVPLKGGLPKEHSCSDETTPCKRGLICSQGTCIDLKTKDDDMFN